MGAARSEELCRRHTRKHGCSKTRDVGMIDAGTRRVVAYVDGQLDTGAATEVARTFAIAQFEVGGVRARAREGVIGLVVQRTATIDEPRQAQAHNSIRDEPSDSSPHDRLSFRA